MLVPDAQSHVILITLVAIDAILQQITIFVSVTEWAHFDQVDFISLGSVEPILREFNHFNIDLIFDNYWILLCLRQIKYTKYYPNKSRHLRSSKHLLSD